MRGDYERCIKTECYHHENWINKQRIDKIQSLEVKYDEAFQLLIKCRDEIFEAKRNLKLFNAVNDFLESVKS